MKLTTIVYLCEFNHTGVSSKTALICNTFVCIFSKKSTKSNGSHASGYEPKLWERSHTVSCTNTHLTSWFGSKLPKTSKTHDDVMAGTLWACLSRVWGLVSTGNGPQKKLFWNCTINYIFCINFKTGLTKNAVPLKFESIVRHLSRKRGSCWVQVVGISIRG